MIVAVSLWPAVVKPDILTPYAILEQQAAALTEQTKGILVGEVSKAYAADPSALFVHLDMIAPLLGGYRRRVLTASHHRDMPYPVRLEDPTIEQLKANEPRNLGELLNLPPLLPSLGEPKRENQADTDVEFQKLVERVLKSPLVTSVAVSLIAKATEVLKEKENQASPRQAAGSEPQTTSPPPVPGAQ